ncbi:hypothetical protein ELG63_36415 [Rhizobium leguminosarum]|uniref:TraM recognition domain-containing protein n=1 Tax=Rhizobium leguminosarum TaxID=384 RepID=UPI0010320DB3|nr:TraM recognition domain-containing protein [Rhizobium leguminosarum]TBH28174.1 hypothetical protein ELG63_36415 [Rhizobium leguminosarum]
MFKGISKAIVKASDYAFSSSKNSIVRGDRWTFATERVPYSQYRSAWFAAPADVVRPPLWDGKLINGEDAATLAWNQIDDDVVSTVLATAGRQALKLSAILAAGVALISYPFLMDTWYMLPEFPTWAVESGAYGAIASWSLQATAAMLWTSGSVAISNSWPIALLFPIFWWNAFTAGMQSLWDRISWRLRAPTSDALTLHRLNASNRPSEIKAYGRQVVSAATRKDTKSLILLGKATGIMRNRGNSRSPLEDQMMCLDEESLGKHVLILGQSGTRKTTYIVTPLFKRIINTDFASGRIMGAYVTDGKGVLHKALRPLVPAHKGVTVVGVDEGQFGVDLIAGLDPQMAAAIMFRMAKQLDKRGDDFWSSGASESFYQCAVIAQVLDRDAVALDIMLKEYEARPYSLYGIYKICIDRDLMKDVIKVTRGIFSRDFKEDGSEYSELLKKAKLACRELETGYLEIAKETADGFMVNVKRVFQASFRHDEVKRRFFCGTYPKEKLVEIEEALNGGVVMIAISPNTENEAGLLAAMWMKSRLMSQALWRQKYRPDLIEKYSCCMIADEYQSLITHSEDDDATDTKFWNVGRSTNLFLIAATQSIAAIEMMVKETAAKNLMNNFATKIVLKTDEDDTIEYYTKMMSQSLMAPVSYDDVYANYEEVIRKENHGPEPGPSYQLKFFDGLWLNYFRPSTKPRRSVNLDHVRAMIDQLKPEEQVKAHMDLNKEIREREQKVVEAMKSQARITVDDFGKGEGFALCMVERAGQMRADFVDFEETADL